jgi:hypothetical protein
MGSCEGGNLTCQRVVWIVYGSTSVLALLPPSLAGDSAMREEGAWRRPQAFLEAPVQETSVCP